MARISTFTRIVAGARTLSRDTAGNTLAIIAAALLPLLGLVGGGVDASRGYMAQARLQQACDAGVLAARKALGSQTPTALPADARTRGERFFDVNFPDKFYGTTHRSFTMTMETDFTISGVAKVVVPTSVMSVFGYKEMPLNVECAARLNFTNLDVMMVIDTTGSMRYTNSGDTLNRIDSVRSVIKDFYSQLEAAKPAGVRTRYGFVPYATNVNVGHLLADDWVVNDWIYQSRDYDPDPTNTSTRTYNTNSVHTGGTRVDWTEIDRYPATVVSTSTDGTVTYSCDKAAPTDTRVTSYTVTGTATETETGPPAIEREIEYREQVGNGDRFKQYISGGECIIEKSTDDNYTETYEKRTETVSGYIYKPISKDVSDWRTETDGCIEERSTYEILDYTNVDLTKALDLNINLVPTPGNSATQWRPMYNDDIYVRELLDPSGSGVMKKEEVASPYNMIRTGTWWMSDCPPAAQNLQEMTTAQLDTYLAGLYPRGATYHDLGMIWGGRLLSQNGLFASENADVGTTPTSRHMIFLTDGQTEPYDIAYGAYGVEGIDQRRWSLASTMSLYDTVTKRFEYACEEVKKNNITVWVIAFGTTLNQSMTKCAGPGRYFEAADSAQLGAAFNSILKSMGDLRVSK